MKKIITLMVSLVLILGISIPTFAAPSPSGDKKFTVKFINGIGSQPSTVTVDEDGNFQVIADTSKGDFNSWIVYKADGSIAKINVDYKFILGDAKSSPAKITPFTDIIITGNYNGKITDPITGTEKKDESPATGDFTPLYCLLTIIAAAGVAVVAKKQLAK